MLCFSINGVFKEGRCVAASPEAPVSPPHGGAPSQNSPSSLTPASLPAPSGFSSLHSSHRQPRCGLRSCPPPCTHWVLGTQVVGFDGSHPRSLVWELGPLLKPQFPPLQSGVVMSTSWAAVEHASRGLVEWWSRGPVTGAVCSYSCPPLPNTLPTHEQVSPRPACQVRP